MTTHDRLVQAARKWLLRKHPVVITEIACGREDPDAIGFAHGGYSTLVECKATRADFLADRRKPARRYDDNGMGDRRYYCIPQGLIKSEEVPEGWGLLELRGRRVWEILGPVTFKKDVRAEMNLLVSTLRRLHLQGHRGCSIRQYQIRTKNRAMIVYDELPPLGS